MPTFAVNFEGLKVRLTAPYKNNIKKLLSKFYYIQFMMAPKYPRQYDNCISLLMPSLLQVQELWF